MVNVVYLYMGVVNQLCQTPYFCSESLKGEKSSKKNLVKKKQFCSVPECSDPVCVHCWVTTLPTQLIFTTFWVILDN